MITLHLNHSNSHEGVYLRLPATPGEVGEAFGMLETLGTGKVSIFDVDSPVRNLGNYIRNADIKDSGVFADLQNLSQRVSKMSPNECRVFAGALDAESINDVGDVLEIANNLDRYVMLRGITNYRELGGFLVDSGYRDVPERLRPYINYEGIGAEYYAERGGAFSTDGYTLRRQTVQEISKRDGAVFRLTLLSPTRSLMVSLPALEEELERAKEYLGIRDFSECEFERYDMIPYLLEMVPDEGITVELANDMADGIDSLRQRDGALMTYYAILSVEQPETFTEAYDLLLEMDNYERVTEDAEAYGRAVLIRHGADAELLEALEGYTDFEAIGEDAMKADGVRRTEFGMIRRCNEPFPDETQYMQMGGM